MKPIKTFIIGSRAFFLDYEDFMPHDNDELNILDEYTLRSGNGFVIRKDNRDVFFYKNMDKDEFIEDTIKTNVSLKVGKFLVPEFAEYLGFEINDLKRLEGMVNKLDTKHQYEKIIFDAYIKNGSFTLTQEQRDEAYKSYKESRK